MPSGVKAKEISIKPCPPRSEGGTGPLAPAPCEEIIYVIGEDNRLYVRSKEERTFEISRTQLPDSARSCPGARGGGDVSPRTIQ